jgi:hypothetical protein
MEMHTVKYSQGIEGSLRDPFRREQCLALEDSSILNAAT